MPVSKKRKLGAKRKNKYYINRYNTDKRSKCVDRETKALLLAAKDDLINNIERDVNEYYSEKASEINKYINEIVLNVDALIIEFNSLESEIDEKFDIDYIKGYIEKYNEAIEDVTETMAILFKSIMEFIDQTSYMKFKEYIKDIKSILQGEKLSNVNVFTHNLFMETLEYKVKGNREVIAKKYKEIYRLEIAYFTEYFNNHFITISEKLNEILERNENFDIDDIKGTHKSFKSRNWKELNKIAKKNGFIHVRDNGDHGIFINSDADRTIIIPQGRDIGKGLQIKIMKTIEL